MRLLKEYFAFSSSERKGIFAFSLLVFALIASYFVLPALFQPRIIDASSFENELLAFQSSLTSDDYKFKEPDKKVGYFTFNPNKASKKDFENLGLTSKLTQTILNFRSKGGRFYKPEDLLKVYGMSQSTYAKLEPWIFLKQTSRESKKDAFVSKDVVLFPFNPNTVSVSDMKTLGFNERQIKTVTNYRKKNGVYRSKEDVRKMYTISDEFYEKIEPYIVIDSVKREKSYVSSIADDRKKISLDLNSASQEDFELLKGIGEKLAQRIIKYRKRIGGFHSLEQLNEVYGLSKETIIDIKPNLTCSSTSINKININTCDMKDLYSHPFLSFNEARIIVNFRKTHGLFTTVNEIKTNDLVKDEVYSKIASYLTVK